MKNIETVIQNVKKKEDFIEFMDLLLNDFRNNGENWENKSLENYLEAIQSWTEDMDGYYLNNNLPIPNNVNWKVFCEILVAARIYE
ncbi:MAG: hypothetical protein DI622_09565 [Chryseobacterium sp.]|uniref:DUF7660 family protein n=1 Tax=Chryseobacterium sp. TaxID=1871047 RepID=UPI000DB4481F|nr:hypothetical protein [Chryseobacterium sp.]MPS66737.1 hypothetical protein [Chryseobacterium sp.]PZU18779.1 MAG: hypothetical protein DI622_09565 [Chryseobacterium sp.]